MIENNIPDVMRGVIKAQAKIDNGARMARDEMMNQLIQLAKEQIKGKRQPGDKAESGKPPMNRTGNLRRSIKGEKMREGFATYSAIVGPTIIYGRRVELGGGNWPTGTKFPYMKPAWERFRPMALGIIRKHLALQEATMAEFFPPVLFEIKASATEALATFGKVNKELATMEKNGVLASGALGKMEKASKLAGTALLGLGGAFAIFGVASVATLDKVEKSQANLEVAIKNTGVSFEAAKPYVDSHAKSMMALGFTYDDTYAALAKMTAASGSPKVALESLGVAADLARAKQISLAEAGTLVARASIGQAKGLGDLGIALGKTLPKGASMAQIFKAIEDRVGGAAKAFKNTLSGGIAVAQANFQALQIEVGTALVPSLIKVTDWITNVGIPKFGEFFNFVKDNKGIFEGFAATMAAIWAVNKISAGVSATIAAINAIKKAYEGLRLVLITTGIAEAYATAGVSVGAATTALAAVGGIAALVYGTSKIPDLTQSVIGDRYGINIASAKPTGAAWSQSMEQANAIPIKSSTIGSGTIPIGIAGKGVKKITPTPKPTATVNQQVTVYASNTNDIASKLAKAAKNGLPLGSKP